MEKFEFKSQICTSVEQSKRLLELGLKKETADMVIRPDNTLIVINENSFIYHNLEKAIQEGYFPAWSLHRLISLFPDSIYHKYKTCFFYLHSGKFCEWRSEIWKWGAVDNVVEIFAKSDVWENLISCTEWLIKQGYFNKDYLEKD